VIVQNERREAAVTLTPVRVHPMGYSQFMRIISAEGLIDEWTRYTAARLQEHRDIITLHVTVDSRQRLAAILLMLAGRLGAKRGGFTVIAGRFTHEDLSQMVGTTRSRIGLFLKYFRRERLVWLTFDSHLMIDEARLRSWLTDHI
jgi:CRP/FNR family cyclic AMP-dependent transcriptional regulator